MSSTKLFATCCFALASAPLAWPQTGEARIAGTMSDAAGAVLAGATVTARNEKTGSSRTVSTNERGLFVIPNLPPAPYTVTGTFIGLGTTEFQHITLTAGQERNLDFV